MLLLCLLLATIRVPVQSSRSSSSLPTATAVAGSERIRLDGRLDEAAWALATPIGPLLQQVPRELQAATEDTEVRVLFDRDNLYLGVVCHDREPKAVVSTQLARDADLQVDDHVTVVIDPFFDQRNGFFFQVNPSGARTDGQISNNQEHLTYDWDGVWDAAARRTADGWVAEMVVPFRSLRFKPSQTVWGFNVERSIKRKQETDRWASARRDVWISNLAEAGRLTGLEGVRQGRGWEMRPYLSGGEERSDAEAKAGLDVTKSLAPNLTGVVTINNDFAETEVDSRQVNLTRFPLFFPEKRQFFLEGAGVYDVAGLGSSNSDLVPFFSRRIGLLGGQEVPVLAGTKLSGRLGDYNLGALDVETGAVDNLQVGGDTRQLDRQNLLAARVSRNILDQSWVGLIATHGNPAGGGSNTLLGADLRLASSRFRGSKNLSLDLWALRTDDEATRRADWALGGKLDYPNDLWDVSLNFKHIGEGFRPALGFVPRVGINKVSSGIAFQPRPDHWGVRQLFFELEPLYVTDLEGRVESWSVFTAPLNLRTESGEHLEWNWIPQFEHLDAPFEIAENVVIPPGSYSFTRYRVEVNTAEKRPWQLDFAFRYGGFYGGELRQLETALTLKPNPHLLLQVAGEVNDVDLPQGAFRTNVYSLKLDYNVSSRITWANLVQYDDESRLLGAQTRFRWTLRPGNDVFLVVNRGWEKRELDGEYLPTYDRGSLKVQYTFRF